MNLEAGQWGAVLVVGLVTGFAKCGLPGAGILAVPVMALAFPARQSVGLLTPILILGDVLAVASYRHHADWSQLARLLPSVAAGLAVAGVALGALRDQHMQPLLGGLVLGLLVMDWLRQRFGWEHVPHHPVFVNGMGFLGGVTTTLGNAAGPIMSIYFLARGLDKQAFMGTFAWYFLIMNAFKVPLSAHLGLILSLIHIS
ncbi:MAG: sulfite exporter TauE/SafE family protein, partial [Verrucomicrobiae bacterium]|nr:sulfite exporter TauE/SafE family protein [Verrucomicrobiae bacterium]